MKNSQDLINIAKQMVQKGKGILAADESTPTCTKRFNEIGIESNFESRNIYRDMLFSSKGIEDYISGVILFDETLRQYTTSENKVLIPEYLNSIGIVPGIKVDKGTKELSGFTDEKITEGLDGLGDRLKEYYDLGARFAKWRAVITIGDSIPSDACIYSNAHSLARYASICQSNGLVPIVEPEVLMNGTHTIETCYEVSKRTLNVVFEQLIMHQVLLEGIVLKPNMIISALDCPEQADVEKVADMTFNCLEKCVPAEVGGIAFLSGGQSSNVASEHLNCMNNKYSNQMPWNLTFSYGRALQQDALNTWAGSNIEGGQNAFLKRAKSNSLATYGKLNETIEFE